MSEINSMLDVELPKRIRVRDNIEGEVVEVKENYILIDLNYFTEGRMYIEHYTRDTNVTDFRKIVKVGDFVNGEVTKVDEENGVILLSRLNQLRNEAFKEIALAIGENDIIEVKVKKKGERGYSVDYKGFEFFMPLSQSGYDVEVGQTYNVKVLEVKEGRKSAVVSKRILESMEYNAKRDAELENINVGDILTGLVSKVENYGAIVRFQTIQGLLRITEIAHTFVNNIKDVLKEGQEIEVKVIKKQNNKIELSKKALITPPYEVFAKNNKVGDTIEGKVVEKLAFGIVLELDKNITGLLHQSEYSWEPRNNFAQNIKLKETIEVAIISMDVEKERIALSKRMLIDNPWSRVKAKVGDLVGGTISSINSKGINIDVLGVTGFIPTKEITFEGKSRKIEDYYATGDSVEGLITNIDTTQWLLEISIKKHTSETERKQFQEYLEKQEQEDESQSLKDMLKDVLK